MKNLTSRFPTLIQYQLAIFVFLLPLFFLPNFFDFFLLPKTLLALIFATLMTLTAIIYSLKQKQLTAIYHPIHLAVLVLLVSFLLSTFIQSPNSTEAWITQGFILFSLAGIYFISTNYLQPQHLPLIKSSLITSTAILSLIVIYQTLGITDPLNNQISWLSDRLWNPSGSPISLIFTITLGLLLAIIFIVRQKIVLIKTSLIIFIILIQGLALTLTINQILTGTNQALLHLPYQYGYSIAIDTLKNWRTALFGFGPGNYLSAFTQFKPATYNQSNTLWNTRFSASSNQYFQALSTGGLLGLSSLLLITYLLIKMPIQKIKTYPDWSLTSLITLLLLVTFDLNPTTISILFIVLIINNIIDIQPKTNIKTTTNITTIIGFSIVSLIILANGWFYLIKYTLADIYFRKSLTAIDQNQATQVYNYQIQAINQNPRQINYRIAYSRTNLNIATNMLKQTNLTQADQQKIVQLIQIAIREAKAAVQLNPQNINGWENLAYTYKQIINTATNADQFAIQAYNQALQLDTRHPRLWVDYGILLQSLNQTDNAITAFRQAVGLKPDYANAHYFLAIAYKNQQKYTNEDRKSSETPVPSIHEPMISLNVFFLPRGEVAFGVI